jgi:hypothetical protein
MRMLLVNTVLIAAISPGAIEGDRGGQPHAALEQVTEQPGPTALTLLVPDGQVQQVFAAIRGDAPHHRALRQQRG